MAGFVGSGLVVAFWQQYKCLHFSVDERQFDFAKTMALMFFYMRDHSLFIYYVKHLRGGLENGNFCLFSADKICWGRRGDTKSLKMCLRNI